MVDEEHGSELPEMSHISSLNDDTVQRTYLWVTVVISWVGASAGFLLLYTVIVFGPAVGLELNLTTVLSASLAAAILFYAGFVITGAVTSALLVKFKLISLSEAVRYSLFSKRPRFWLRSGSELSSSKG